MAGIEKQLREIRKQLLLFAVSIGAISKIQEVNTKRVIKFN